MYAMLAEQSNETDAVKAIFTSRILGLNALLGELRTFNSMKQHVIGGWQLSFVSKTIEIIDNDDTISGQSLSRLEISEHTMQLQFLRALY